MVISPEDLAIFNLYYDEDYEYFFGNSEKVKISSIRYEKAGVFNVLSLILYSKSLDKLFLLPSCLVESGGEFYIPSFIEKHKKFVFPFLEKGIKRAELNETIFMHLPKDIRWIKESSQKLNRYYLCINDLPTGIHHLRRYHHIYDKLITRDIKGSLLEIGHGMAYFQNLLNRRFNYFAFDIDNNARVLAEKIDLYDRSKILKEFPDGKFDVVVSLETLEHVKNPFEFMDKIGSVSHSETKFFISVPEEEFGGSHLNYDHISNWNFKRVNTFFSRYFEKVNIEFQRVFDFSADSWFENSKIEQVYRGSENTETYMIEAEKFKHQKFPVKIIKRSAAAGDVLLSEPVVRRLKEKNPGEFIVFATKFTELFKGNPYVDMLLKDGSYGDFSLFPVSEDMEVINLDYSYEKSPEISILKNYSRKAGLNLLPSEISPRVFLNLRDYLRVIKILSCDDLKQFPYLVCVNIGNKFSHDRTLPPDIVKYVVEKLTNDFNAAVMFIGSYVNYSPKKVIGEEFFYVDLVGKTSLTEVISLLSFSDLLVSPDSGPIHFAASVGCPSLAFFGMALPENRVDYTNLVYP
ncbi:methyltransferase domain-containing protein, partial [Desulfurobacterium sp.]